jgi:hypothetical protein
LSARFAVELLNLIGRRVEEITVIRLLIGSRKSTEYKYVLV